MCIGSFYDILVFSADITEHEKHLGMVFTVLRDNQLFANKKKCVIAYLKILYLGHQIYSKRVEADEDKIKSMVNWPQPKDVIGLWGFLGLTGIIEGTIESFLGFKLISLTNITLLNILFYVVFHA